MKRSFLAISVLACIAFVNAGTVYKVVLDDGTVMYTDKPVPNSEPVSIQSTATNSIPALAQPIPTNTPSQTPVESVAVSIQSPAPDATIRNNEGRVTISANSSPQGSFAYQLWFDGIEVDTNSSGTFSLKDVHRGAHQYFIVLKDNTGKTLASSDTQTLFMHKASALINAN